MDAVACGGHWLLRIDKGEEIVESLKRFCTDKGVRLGSVSGIGATDRVTLGLFRTGTKEYRTRDLEGDHEITSLAGNVSTMAGETYIHLHITLSDEGCRAFGGHLSSAVVSGTCELVLRTLEGEVDRAFDEDVGLNLFSFPAGSSQG